MKERNSVTVTPDFIHSCACQQVVPSWLSQMCIVYTVQVMMHMQVTARMELTACSIKCSL